MFYSMRNAIGRQISQFKQTFIQRHDLPFDDIILNQDITQFIEQAVAQRDRVFTPLVTLKAFIAQVLSEDGSCRHVVRETLIKSPNMR